MVLDAIAARRRAGNCARKHPLFHSYAPALWITWVEQIGRPPGFQEGLLEVSYRRESFSRSGGRLRGRFGA